MKHVPRIITAGACLLAGSGAAMLAQQGAPGAPMTANRLIAPWSGPYGGVPPWDQVRPEHFAGALESALAEQRAEIGAIVASREEPTFENTIAALERAGRTRQRIEPLFAVARENITNPQFQALEREWQPKLTAASDAIYMNGGLFQRIEAVHHSLPSSTLAPDQKRLTTLVYDIYVRRGAKIETAQKARLSKINQDLATLFSEFRQKVLADENTWIVLESQADLAGLPASMVGAAKAAATERKLEGTWAIVNTRSSVDPFLTFSSRRDLRERVWNKFKSRGDNGDQNDTKTTIARIVKLRADRAKLLGYPSHAHWRMADTMARSQGCAGADDADLAGRRCACQGRGRRHADNRGARKRAAHDRAVGLPLLRGKGTQGAVRP